MATLEDVKHIKFVTEVLYVSEGRKLGAMTPDEHGYYDIPLAALGVPTRNRTYYDVKEFVDQVTNPNAYAYQRLSLGEMYGEYDHPDIAGMSNDLALQRLAKVDPKHKSHHIRSIYTGETLESGAILLKGKVKPHGPYAGQLEDNFKSPYMNTAFSLRAITDNVDTRELSRRKMARLVTFDNVPAGGYKEASKRYASCESISISFTDTLSSVTHSALESILGTDLNDLFKTKHITMKRDTYVFVPDAKAIVGTDRKLRSLVMESLKG